MHCQHARKRLHIEVRRVAGTVRSMPHASFRRDCVKPRISAARACERSTSGSCAMAAENVTPKRANAGTKRTSRAGEWGANALFTSSELGIYLKQYLDQRPNIDSVGASSGSSGGSEAKDAGRTLPGSVVIPAPARGVRVQACRAARHSQLCSSERSTAARSRSSTP
jgi:hypothetical protein